MKDIDKLLKQHTLSPSKPLAESFTTTVVKKINNTAPRHGWTQLLSGITNRLHTKAGIAGLAGILLIGGTAAAISVWPTPTVKQVPVTHSQTLSGNHVVAYDTTNCNYFGNTSSSAKTKETVYYEVKQSSKLTDQQLQHTLQGLCEENLSNNAINAIVANFQKQQRPLQGSLSTPALTVIAVAKDAISLKLDPHYDASVYTVSPQTYQRFAKDLVVYNQSSKASLSDIKPGDTVKLLLQDDSGKSTETAENYQPQNHPEHITVLAIIKTPALTADPTTFYSGVATDFVRVEPCASSPTGFCRAYDFAGGRQN